MLLSLNSGSRNRWVQNRFPCRKGLEMTCQTHSPWTACSPAWFSVWPAPCIMSSWWQPVYTHCSATTKCWYTINPIWTESRTRRGKSAVLNQIMACNFTYFGISAQCSPVKSKKKCSGALHCDNGIWEQL